jgi:hypothetical protein
LNVKGDEFNQLNLILPEPCEFLHRDLSGARQRPALTWLLGGRSTVVQW